MLPGYRGFAACRAVLPKPTPWLVRFFPDRGRRISAAAARAAAALARLVAAAARRLHGGAVLWSSVPQQLAPHSELVSLLGRLLGKLATSFHIICVHGTHECMSVVSPPWSQVTTFYESFKMQQSVWGADSDVGEPYTGTNAFIISLFTILKTEMTTEKKCCVSQKH